MATSKKSKKVKKDKSKVKNTSSRVTTLNLAAKYRPNSIEDYYGQDHLVKMVQGWKKTGRWPSTIMISGTTGSGKTTLARILTRIVNCETNDACGECTSCSMSTKSHPDVVELNMGVVGKVDDVRALVKTADFAPRTNKRVFILDESHLMTKQANSALLVPTEEPPEHTMWIFCTTDPEKMLDTIRNRCTQLSIRPIPANIMAKRLQEICKYEKVAFDDKKEALSALKYIADFSDGQMRKGISQLDSLIGAVSSGEPFSKDTVISSYSLTNDVDLEKQAVKVVAAVLSHDIEGVLQFIMETDNHRSLMGKMRWLVQWVIQDAVGAAKFTPYIGKMFNKLVKTKGFDYSLPVVINLQYELIQIELAWNSSSVPEDILMQTTLAKICINDYYWSENSERETKSKKKSK